eukprot:g2103.t1 g2103   contig11:721472-722983(+)
MTSAVEASSTPPPPQWPREVCKKYSPIRVIGKGGFASVWMAKAKDASSEKDAHVAIKVVGDDEYAQREVAILSELSQYHHPNIIRLIGHYTPDDGDTHDASARAISQQTHCVVLSLARGPTLAYILEKEGALGLIMAQTVSRQLIGAVAFLHGHAVIHRDIQPCNIIVSGASMDDDLWWSDTLDVDGKVLEMAKRCTITLIDFGFARALSPSDLKSDLGLNKAVKERESKQSATEKQHNETCEQDEEKGASGFSCINEPLHDLSSGIDRPTFRGRSRSRDTNNMDSSASHRPVRDLSALGTRSYAAPEILSGLRRVASSLNLSLHKQESTDGSTRSTRSEKTERKKRALGECVSSYGLIADAFSVGSTIRYMVTGVPPSINVEEFMESRNHILRKMVRGMKKRVRGNTKKRSKKYRSSEDIPEDVSNLIQVLTHYDSRKRATIRSTTKHPWIVEKVQPSTSSSPIIRFTDHKVVAHETTGQELSPEEHGGPIVYLQCAANNIV